MEEFVQKIRNSKDQTNKLLEIAQSCSKTFNEQFPREGIERSGWLERNDNQLESMIDECEKLATKVQDAAFASPWSVNQVSVRNMLSELNSPQGEEVRFVGLIDKKSCLAFLIFAQHAYCGNSEPRIGVRADVKNQNQMEVFLVAAGAQSLPAGCTEVDFAKWQDP
ncbi:MAG: hypothetical protein LBH53_03540 [Puniceicoccales bacterium]|nr:hypothetical protein [Puniceicoccales bacterium]